MAKHRLKLRDDPLLVERIMTPGEAGRLSAQISIELEKIPGWDKLPITIQVQACAACLRFYCHGWVNRHYTHDIWREPTLKQS